jgi:RNA polymerase sigma-70 factor, ECF subfamily
MPGMLSVTPGAEVPVGTLAGAGTIAGPMSDDLDAWMTAARDTGDQDAYAQVIENCHHLIRATLLRETADPELADEIAQEALARAWAKREQYRPGTSPRAWLLSIARSQLMEHHRRQDRDRRHLRELVRQELLRHAPNVQGRENQLRLVALKACVAELGEEHRQLIDLVHNQGMTSDAAAEILGIKPPACRQRLSRLQRALKTCAEKRIADGDKR